MSYEDLSKEAKIADGIFGFVAGFGTMALSGVVFKDMWNWFIADQFGLMRMTWQQAIGVSFVYGFVLIGVYTQLAKKAEEKKQSATTMVFVRAAIYLLTWGCAALWHLVVWRMGSAFGPSFI